MSLDLPAATRLSRRTMALSVGTAVVASASIAAVGVGDSIPPAAAALVLLALALPIAVQLLLVRRTLGGLRAFAATLGGSPSITVDGSRCELAWPDLDLRVVGTTAASRDRRLVAVVEGERRPFAPRAARGAALEIARELEPAGFEPADTGAVAGADTPVVDDGTWNGRVAPAYDPRVVALVVGASAAAASLNVVFGEPLLAGAAFALLTCVGVVGHVLGERRLRRVVAALVTEWTDSGGRVTAVTRSDRGTEWIVHTPEGRVTVGGLAMAPVSTVTIDVDGIDDALPAARAERRLETVAAEWYAVIFA